MSGDTLPDSAKRPAADDAAGEDEASKRARMSEGGSIEQPLAPKRKLLSRYHPPRYLLKGPTS